MDPQQVLADLRAGVLSEDEARRLLLQGFIQQGMSENNARLRAEALLTGGQQQAEGFVPGQGPVPRPEPAPVTPPPDPVRAEEPARDPEAINAIIGDVLTDAVSPEGLSAVDEIVNIADQVRNRELSRADAISTIKPLTRLGTNEAAERVLDAVVGPDFFTGLGAEPEVGAGSTDPLTSLPGVDPAFANLLRQEQRQGAVGAEGLFRQLTEPLTRGLNPLGRQAVESRFDPLFTSFITDPARIEEARTGSQPTLEEAIRSFGQGEQTIAGPQEILQRLVNIGGMVGTTDPAEETFVAPFRDPDIAETLFTNAATRRLNPFFRGAAQDVLARDIERFRFQNPEDLLIAEIFRRGGRVF